MVMGFGAMLNLHFCPFKASLSKTNPAAGSQQLCPDIVKPNTLKQTIEVMFVQKIRPNCSRTDKYQSSFDKHVSGFFIPKAFKNSVAS